MADRGWYSDPGGQPGMYRYWDGTAWSEALSPTPAAPPPSFAVQNPYGQYSYGQSTPANVGYGQDPYAYQSVPQTKPKRAVGTWILLAVIVVVVALVIWLAVTQIFGGSSGGILNNDPDPQNTSTTAQCPKQATVNERDQHPSGDGRVYGGDLSYPELGSPWSAVDLTDSRIPFGRDTAEQTIVIHANYAGLSSWVASIMIAELYAGDGFYSPEEGSEIVNACIFGTFYGDAKVTPEVRRSEAYPVDGKDGWITVTNLTFSIPNLPTTSELVTVIIVATSAMSSSIFYASIPGDASQYNSDVDQAIAGLRVET